MNIQQAAARWEVSEKTARKICDHMQVDPDDIPEDLRPVYVDDRYKDDPHRLYLVLLDVIINTHLELEGMDPVLVGTCLKQLREEGLIVVKNGRDPESNDYHDYVLTPDKEKYYSWHESRTKDSLNILKRIVALIRTLF